MNALNIMVIGSGNMGKPMIRALLEHQHVMPENLSIVTGASAGNDAASVRALLNDLPHADKVTLFSHKEPYTIAAQDIVIFAAKPQQLEAALAANRLAFKDGTLLISIAGGIALQRYKEMLRPTGKAVDVVRTMPHIPRALIGIYAEKRELSARAATLLDGMGEAFILAEEGQMHTFAAHAGCGPAFVAQFIHRLAQEQRIPAGQIATGLRKAVAGNPDHPSAIDHFYHAWLGKAQEDFGVSQGKKIVDDTVSGTLDYMEKNRILPSDLATAVRSPKGMTNAGLIVMGSPPPDHEKFGNASQRQAQAKWAEKFQSLPVANSIAGALDATLQRSEAMATLGENPLGGVDFAGILQRARAQG